MCSLFFHKARALRHTSELRYNARSLRHRYERAQFTIHFTNEVKKLVPRALLSFISTWKFLRTLEKCKKHSPSTRASPHLSRVLKKFPRACITQQCTRRVFYFFIIGNVENNFSLFSWVWFLLTKRVSKTFLY